MCTIISETQIPILDSYVKKGVDYLEKSCRPITGFQNDCIGKTRDNLEKGYFPEELFTNLVALDLLGGHLSTRCKGILRKFVALDEKDGTGTINFNKYASVIPDDVEDTALYHYVFLKEGFLQQNDKKILDVARLIYLNVDRNGIIQLYYPPCEDKSRERVEAGCLSNAMRFLYYVGASDEATKTENYLYEWLVSEKYLKGTRYYPSPDTFLFLCSKAVVHNEKARKRFEQPLLTALRKRIVETRMGPLYALDIAMRILALNNLGKVKSPDLLQKVQEMTSTLVSMQDKETGAWPKDALFKLGSSETYLGGSVISTIFATAALTEIKNSQ